MNEASFVGDAGAEVSACASVDSLGGPHPFEGSIAVFNFWEPLDGNPSAIAVEDVVFAVTDSSFGLNRLNEGLFSHPDIVWVDHASFVVEPNSSYSINAGPVQPGQNILFSCTRGPLDPPPLPALAIWQLPIEFPTAVEPTTWGRVKSMFR